MEPSARCSVYVQTTTPPGSRAIISGDSGYSSAVPTERRGEAGDIRESVLPLSRRRGAPLEILDGSAAGIPESAYRVTQGDQSLPVRAHAPAARPRPAIGGREDGRAIREARRRMCRS